MFQSQRNQKKNLYFSDLSDQQVCFSNSVVFGVTGHCSPQSKDSSSPSVWHSILSSPSLWLWLRQLSGCTLRQSRSWSSVNWCSHFFLSESTLPLPALLLLPAGKKKKKKAVISSIQARCFSEPQNCWHLYSENLTVTKKHNTFFFTGIKIIKRNESNTIF